MKSSRVLFLLASFALAFAQEKHETLNVYGSLGFGIPTGGFLLSSTTQDQNDQTKRKDFYLNYGGGFKIDLGAQYYMMENVALQGGIAFSAGMKNITTDDRTADPASDYSTKYSHRNLFAIKVLVVPRFEILELMNVYTGVGLGLFWNSLHYDITEKIADSKFSENGKIKTSPKIGFLGEVGADYPLSDLMSLYGEIGFEMVSFTWDKQVIEKTSIPTHKTGTEVFLKDAANQQPPQRVPGSNWQIRFGARFNIL